RSELYEWHSRYQVIAARVPEARERLAADRKLLCLSAENAKKARETLGYFEASCANGKTSCKAAETKRLTAWRTEQESDLKVNTERFTIKWGENRLAAVECLKDTNEITTTDITGRTTLNNLGGRSTDSVGR
ncbi:MAG: hypothetical protein ABL958_22045, partial [Bdellovibrionia bacterium]